MKQWEVMRAYEEGAEIEVFYGYSNSWVAIDEPDWNWDKRTYRVKKEPKVIETWTGISGDIWECLRGSSRSKDFNNNPRYRLIGTREVSKDV